MDDFFTGNSYSQLMMKTSKILIIFFLTILTFKASGQTADWELKENSIDSICTVKAKEHINTLLGRPFADKHLSYYGIFRHSERVVLFKVSGCLSRNKLLPIFFDGSSIDTINSIVDKKDILKCPKQNSNYWIDSIEVMKIAKAATDFKNYKFDIQFVYFSGKKTNPTWNVNIIFYQTIGGYGEGETVRISALTGKHELSNWHVQP